jgi:phenylacetic acid degradation operon negative regulatory protein
MLMASAVSFEAGRAAPVPFRRHAAGSDSAGGLLFTVLGEFVLPGGGSAWTSTFIDVLSRLGVEEKASRQALMRSAEKGWLRSSRVGRRTRWALTPEAEQLLTEGASRIYSFAGHARSWDGRWLLVLTRIPETERSARHLLRTRLSWAGFGSPAPGVWLSAHTERLAEAEHALRQASVLEEAPIFVVEHQGGGDMAEMARRAWDLEAIEVSYREFVLGYGARDVGDPLAGQVDLVHAWRRFPWLDPALPLELLPADWSGERAARLFREWHDRLAVGANAEWSRLDGTGELASFGLVRPVRWRGRRGLARGSAPWPQGRSCAGGPPNR